MNVQRRIVDEEFGPVWIERRQWLRAAIAAIGAGIAATLSGIVGGAVVATPGDRQEEQWLPAGRTGDLATGVPTAVTLRVTRQDGYYDAVERQVVFLVKGTDGDVRALSSTCTHLGCRVSYDAAADVFKCPCHGGQYSADGRVVSGPPPRPLEQMATRVEGARVLVKL